MTETTFPLLAHGWVGLFLVSYAYTSLLSFWSGLVWSGLVFIVLSDFLVSGAKGSGGGWTRHLSLHLYFLRLFHYLLGDTRDRAGNRNVQNLLQVCWWAHWVPLVRLSFLSINDFKGSNGINRAGVKDGDRETVLTLGLRPGQRELDHLRSDSAC